MPPKRPAGFTVAALALLGIIAPPAAAAPAPTTVAPLWATDALVSIDATRESPAVIGRTIIITTPSGIAALDSGSGRRLWSAKNAVDPIAAGTIVYANRPSTPPAFDRLALAAFDAHDGHQVWNRPGAGGSLGADETGVVVANQRGVTRFGPDGAKRWTSATPGGYRRVIVNDRYVVALSIRSGALMHGEIESFERRTGRLIGTQVWFGWGDLLALDAHSALGASDFPGDFETWCGTAELLDVSLDTVSADYRDILAEKRTDYVLEDLSFGTPPPPGGAYADSARCTGPRSGHPSIIIIDGAYVALASGPVLGLFDRTVPAAPFARYRDATFVGGPSAGHLYVARPHGLDVLTIGDRHSPRFDPLVVKDAATFTVAGLGARLYVSDGTTTTAFDDRTFAKRAQYGFGCAHLVALTQTELVDVLECDRDSNHGQIVAVRR